MHKLWQNSAGFHSIISDLHKGESVIRLSPFPLGFGAMLAAGLATETSRPLFCITPDIRSAEHWQQNLQSWLGDSVDLLPELDIVPYHVMARSQEISAERVRVLHRMTHGLTKAVVAPVAALLRAMPPHQVFVDSVFTLKVGERLERDILLTRLLRMGYERVDTVRVPGQVSVRGGIMDLFPPSSDEPLRCEWFDDEIDSLRLFDAETQISHDSLQETVIVPAREIIWPDTDPETPLVRLQQSLDPVKEPQVRQRVAEEMDRLPNEPGLWEAYASYLYERLESVLDYRPQHSLIILWRPERVREQLRNLDRQWRRRTEDLFLEGQILDGQRQLQLSPAQLGLEQTGQRLLFEDLTDQGNHPDSERVYSFDARSVPSLQGQWQLIEEELGRKRKQGWQIVISLPDRERAERLRELLETRRMEGTIVDAISPGKAGIFLLPDTELDGFEASGLHLMVLNSQQLIGGPLKRKARRSVSPGGKQNVQTISHWQDLQPGDYVVHVSHGIGRYMGMKTMEVQGTLRDYLVLQYEGEDRLYVPTDQIDLVQKYVGNEGKAPKLYRLGGSDWARVKQRVKESVRKMAEELLRLYAARQAVEGHAFAKDTPWQRQFEDAFPYEETPDQIKAIAEIKRDMESTRPMDRLLCGDVGYGKTEVAMRSAFKAVMDDHQVAILVPTTILAQQHYLTLKKRFEGFPVKLAMLSRFITEREQQQVITDLRRGQVDIVVGTHRLLADDVDFKRLGLLIIDEEQRFGVRHKEKLKQLRNRVDVLTLTATPIPRTLHMGMVGLRDMSLIETPPENRYPVETFVVEYSDGLVKDAIEKEIARGGQVYYVFNRVRGIEQVSNRLRQLIPEARIAVAHGQLTEDELERVMMDFMEGHYDVLVCTTIIESGLDIPNVNTLIVQDSERFGLAQLYQIRGRVGRSNRLAYAYFTYHPGKILSEVAEKRLRAIKEFTELGSGFKIALRDLEIRGAGNILGPEQSGFIVSVGFDLYAQMLEEAVRELRGDGQETSRWIPSVEMPVDAYLPDEYIADSAQKSIFYKRMNNLESFEELESLHDELLDRFGEPPRPVENLLQLARLRILAADLMALNVLVEHGEVKVIFPIQLQTVIQEAQSLVPHWQRRLTVELRPKPMLRLRKPGLGSLPDGQELLRDTLQLLTDVAELPGIEAWRRSGAPSEKTLNSSPSSV